MEETQGSDYHKILELFEKNKMFKIKVRTVKVLGKNSLVYNADVCTDSRLSPTA